MCPLCPLRPWEHEDQVLWVDQMSSGRQWLHSFSSFFKFKLDLNFLLPFQPLKMFENTFCTFYLEFSWLPAYMAVSVTGDQTLPLAGSMAAARCSGTHFLDARAEGNILSPGTYGGDGIILVGMISLQWSSSHLDDGLEFAKCSCIQSYVQRMTGEELLPPLYSQTSEQQGGEINNRRSPSQGQHKNWKPVFPIPYFICCSLHRTLPLPWATNPL